MSLRATITFLSDVATHLIKNMDYGKSFKYYTGTSAHDEDYIEYGIHKITFYGNGRFCVQWHNTVLNQLQFEILDWVELTEFLEEEN